MAQLILTGRQCQVIFILVQVKIRFKWVLVHDEWQISQGDHSRRMTSDERSDFMNRIPVEVSKELVSQNHSPLSDVEKKWITKLL
jgi:hypothetical protein